MLKHWLKKHHWPDVNVHVSVESLLQCGTSMHPMPCVSCGHANPGTAKFCNECGSPCRKVPSIKVEKSARTIKRLMSFSCRMRLTSFFRKMISSSHPGVQCEARVPCIRRSGCGVVQDPPRARAHGESRAEGLALPDDRRDDLQPDKCKTCSQMMMMMVNED